MLPTLLRLAILPMTTNCKHWDGLWAPAGTQPSGEHHDLTATSLSQNRWYSQTPWKPLASHFIYYAIYAGLEIQPVFAPIVYILNEFVWPRHTHWHFQLICHLKFIFISAILKQETVDWCIQNVCTIYHFLFHRAMDKNIAKVWLNP